jgi:hypothetical protein
MPISWRFEPLPTEADCARQRRPVAFHVQGRQAVMTLADGTRLVTPMPDMPDAELARWTKAERRRIQGDDDDHDFA